MGFCLGPMVFYLPLKCTVKPLNSGGDLTEYNLTSISFNICPVGISSTVGKESSDSCRSTSESTIFIWGGDDYGD